MALEHLSAAIEPEWESILYVDVAMLDRLATWLVTYQDQNTGAFWNPSWGYFDIKYMVSSLYLYFLL